MFDTVLHVDVAVIVAACPTPFMPLRPACRGVRHDAHHRCCMFDTTRIIVAACPLPALLCCMPAPCPAVLHVRHASSLLHDRHASSLLHVPSLLCRAACPVPALPCCMFDTVHRRCCMFDTVHRRCCMSRPCTVTVLHVPSLHRHRAACSTLFSSLLHVRHYSHRCCMSGSPPCCMSGSPPCCMSGMSSTVLHVLNGAACPACPQRCCMSGTAR